jgi:ABC-type phosphate/phosphonate transport system ATPase subunit
MKIVTASNGKETVKMSKKEWESLGKKAGWMRTAQPIQQQTQPVQQQTQPVQQQSDRSNMTFERLMQDPSFKKTFETLKSQKANKAQILDYWKQNGINYTSMPEILEVIDDGVM